MINFRTTLLYMLSRLNGQRTVYAAYHILRGKKSSQTIQDIHLFQLKFAFGLFPKLRKEQYTTWLNQFMKDGLIEVHQDSFHISSNVSSEMIELDPNIFSVFNGFNYHRFDDKWLGVLQLLMQTLSNLMYENKRFIPINDDQDIQMHVKQLLTHSNHETLSIKLKQELASLLEDIDDLCANIFTAQLTGFNRIGLNRNQITDLYQMREEDIQLITKATVHFILDVISSQPKNYPVLNNLIINTKQSSLTTSAHSTYELLKRGYNFKQIESKRRLKESTIQDHVIEIATQIDDFDITVFVDQKTIERIVFIINQTNSKRLKTLMNELDHSVSYFQLRLVLAKYHTYKESVSI